MIDWRPYFPYESPREQQIQALDFIFKSWFEDKKKFAILDAPTGVGKSAIAMTVANFFKDDRNKINSSLRGSYVVTTETILQSQYTNEYSDKLASIWSKKRYKCEGRGGVTCDVGTIVNKMTGGIFCKCQYLKDKESFIKSDISLTNMTFLLNQFEHGKAKFDTINRNCMIIDEAHNAERIMTDFATIELSKYYLESHNIAWIVNNKLDYDKLIEWARDVVFKKLAIKKVAMNERLESYAKLKTNVENNASYKKLMDDYINIDKFVCHLGMFFKLYEKNKWVFYTNEDQTSIFFKPLFSNEFMNMLYDKGEKILLMSATILDDKIFTKANGITNYTYMTLTSPFPKENRPIHHLDCGQLNMKSISKTMPTIISTIESLLSLPEHANQKGIIHCNSYLISKAIQAGVKNRRLIFHKTSDRAEALKKHLLSDGPTVLVSPSLTEGLDLIDDLSRFQIIVKVPFPYLGDHYIKAKMNLIDDWYQWQTVKCIVQSSGRSVRSETDYATTYILDGDFKWFYKKNISMFPLWWREALTI
jgi:Rad3-related DNA helicase